MNHITDTIIAPATPQVKVLSLLSDFPGTDAIAITDHIFKGEKLAEADSHTIHYGWIMDEEKEIDEVMVSVFRAPKTFTTEDSTEISCHGSPHLVQAIISLAIKNGAKSAFPGEFTLRAFLNGRLDLSQAEAVADLIHASSTKSSEIALNQLKGHFSQKLKDLRQELINFAALIELELDFSEEDVEFAHRGRLKDLIHKIMKVINPMLDSFRWGNSIKEGISVAIIGAPNVGKSTLLNTILNEEKALVSDIAGTTRDFIEDTLVIDGVVFRFIDTAGIRETTDVLEGLGIERSKQKLREAEIVLFISDIHNSIENTITEYQNLALSKDQTGVILLNKADTIAAAQAEHKTQTIADQSGVKTLHITAKYSETLQPLLNYFFRLHPKPQSCRGHHDHQHQRLRRLGKHQAMSSESVGRLGLRTIF
ncbi:MAG: tRNA uridine-5-carboxymethylaminomethyl(34) synthesis GTPase MnmE [Saprospiraceae bacterium]|nr:tRNA uridine-5-carboxymethylaminomethyl(34) synthesis GTPase MnmE [Saprospiraceae bacterium]